VPEDAAAETSALTKRAAAEAAVLGEEADDDSSEVENEGVSADENVSAAEDGGEDTNVTKGLEEVAASGCSADEAVTVRSET
jgi:hypothetical protein